MTEISVPDAVTDTVVSLSIIVTDSDHVTEDFYATEALALKAARRYSRYYGLSMRKSTPHRSNLTDGGFSLAWDIYESTDRNAQHVGYIVVRNGVLVDNTRAYVLVHDAGTVIAGTYTDTDKDTDDIAIAVADTVAEYMVATGGRKLAWTAPSKLTDAQQQNPENGDSWTDVHASVAEMVAAARPYYHASHYSSLAYTVGIPECQFCEDGALVSAWQNARDSLTEYGAVPSYMYGPNDGARLRETAREFVMSPDWADLGRCVECAGKARGLANDSAEYAYRRVDETFADNAPQFIREAAERLALWANPRFRMGDREPAKFKVTIRNQTDGTFTDHQLISTRAADEISLAALERIQRDLSHVRYTHIAPKVVPDTQYSPGLMLVNAENGSVLAYADVHFRAVTKAMAKGEIFPSEPAKLERSSLTGVQWSAKNTRANLGLNSNRSA